MYPAALAFNGLLIVGWPLLDPQPLRSWLVVLLLMTLFTLIAGRGVTGMWRGALIDERNTMSLSRFQMALWTVLILSAFFCAAMHNVAAGDAAPLRIVLPQELWALMGISSTSLVASPLILSTKTDASRALSPGVAPTRLVNNPSPALARWSDLFTGEEAGNGAHLDLTRIQMFFFTVVTVVAYAGSVWARFRDFPAAGLHDLPVLDASMVTLLGISHTGYLVAKAVPRTP
nr:hypothetical protein [uncultured Roseateles sp.]